MADTPIPVVRSQVSVLIFSLAVLVIASLWVSYVVAVGLRRNARWRVVQQENRPARPISSPYANHAIAHPAPDLYRPGHAATHHPAA